MRRSRYRKNELQRAFIDWLGTYAQFSVPVRVKERRDRCLALEIEGLNPAIQIELIENWRTDDLVVAVDWQGECWDLLLSGESAPSRMDRGYIDYARLPKYRSVYTSREALWVDLLFDPFLWWFETELIAASWVALYGDKIEATWAHLLSAFDKEAFCCLPLWPDRVVVPRMTTENISKPGNNAMEPFTLIGSDHNKLEILVQRYERARTGDYYDDNWLDTQITVRAGGFSGHFQATVLAPEWVTFREQLRTLRETRRGEAVFCTLEKQLSLRLVANGRDPVKVSGVAMDQPGTGNLLEFMFTLNRVNLKPALADLNDIIATFPVRDA